MFRPIAAGRLPSRVPQGDEPRRRTQITLPLPFRSISPAPIIASMPLRLLLKTLQCFFTKQVRVPLACFGELDDLVGDDLVSNRIVINFYPSISKRGANQLIRYSHNAHGLGSNEWDEPRRNFLNGIGRLVQRIEQLSWLGLPLEGL